MNPTVQRVCVWCGPAFLVFFGIGFWLFAGFLPPPSPAASADQIAQMYRDHTTGIRTGIAVMIVGTGFLIPWVAIMSVQLKRIEGRQSPLTRIAEIAGTVEIPTLFLPMVVVGVAAYRPTETSPETLRTLNDLAWLSFTGVIAPMTAIHLATAAAILTDKRPDPVFPRWCGIFNLVVWIFYLPGAVIYFFHDGPLAWDGGLGWWVQLVAWTAWFWVMLKVLLDAIKHGEREAAPHAHAPAAA